jgi:alpha,alpha-trehalose phosphorylase
MSLVFGFGGFRWRAGGVRFRPMLPTRARRLRFPMLIGQNQLRVDIQAHAVTYTLEWGTSLELGHYDEVFTLEVGSPVTFAGDFHTRDTEAH